MNMNIYFFYLSLFLGKANFSDIKIIFDPQKTALLVVTSQAIEKYYTEFLSLLNYDNQIEFDKKYIYFISISIRECERGEIYINFLNM